MNFDEQMSDQVHCPLCERARKIIGKETPCYRHEYKKPSNEQLEKIKEAARVAKESWREDKN